MKRILIAVFQLYAICTCVAQAPSDWRRVAEAKDITGAALPLRQLGVWRSPDDQVTVQVLQLQPIKTQKEVWNTVGGLVSGLTRSDQAPTASALVLDTPQVCFRLSGKGKQEGGALGMMDTYVVFADSATYLVKVFSATTTSVFSITTWDFGQPITGEHEDLTRALSQIKERLDSGLSLSASNSSSPGSQTSPGNSQSARTPIDGQAQSRRTYLDGNDRLDRGARDPLYQVSYAIGFYGLPLALLAFIVSRWTRRVSRKTAVGARTSKARFYALMLLKMSWRVPILVVLSFALVLLAHTGPAVSEKEITEAIETTMALFLVFLPPIVLLTSWTQTRRKFSQPTSTTSEGTGR